MRLNRPIGFMLLFWPCAWSFGTQLYENEMDRTWCLFLFLFFIGSILMRSAGCVYNDIIDKEIDKKVSRTKNRPLAKNLISIKMSWIIILTLCLAALAILFQFNFKAIMFGLSSGILIALYPFMKRITFWPQLFLGIVFNWGVILGWLVFNENINLHIFLLYISAILWTLGYDTIYGLQDLEDDVKIGVKSTAIKFQKNLKTFLLITYLLSFLFFISSMLILMFEFNFLILFFVGPFLLLLFQVYQVTLKNSNKNLSLFKLNNYYGLSIFIIQIVVFHNA